MGTPLIGTSEYLYIPKSSYFRPGVLTSGAGHGWPCDHLIMESRKADEREATTETLRKALEIARAEAGFRASRSSGPGGQHAQKNETRIEAFLELDSCSLDEATKERLRERFGHTVRAVSQDERSQLRNRELALERLLGKIRVTLEPRAERTATKPSRSAILSRLATKRHRSIAKRLRRPPGSED